MHNRLSAILPFPLGRHPLTTLGALVSASALACILAGLALDFFGQISSPYAGILLYGLLPPLLLLGLFLQWIGSRLARRAGRPPAYVLDWSQPADRRRAWLGIGILGCTGLALAGATHESLEYMGTDHFCAEVCHRTMEPQAVTHRLSTHSRVACVDCHIGPGVNGFVRAKLGGLRQTIGEFTGRFPRPTRSEAPDRVLGRVVCERCHSSVQDHGIVARVKTTYTEDEEQARTDQVVKTRVGSEFRGIHAHLGMQIRYLSPDHGETVTRLEVVRRDGSRVEYVRKAAESGEGGEGHWGTFGCTSCHNRTGHDVMPFDRRLDLAFRAGTLPEERKGLKKAAMEAVGEPEGEISHDTYTEIRRRLRAAAGSDERVGRELQRLYASTTFPEMKTGAETYPSFLGHKGCYRCHGAMTPLGGGQSRLPTNTQCLSCHVMP